LISVLLGLVAAGLGFFGLYLASGREINVRYRGIRPDLFVDGRWGGKRRPERFRFRPVGTASTQEGRGAETAVRHLQGRQACQPRCLQV